MIRFKNIKRSKNISKKLQHLYYASFPREERQPYFLIKKRALSGSADFFGIYDNNRFIGLLYTVAYKDIVYVYFLAIANEYRGCGFGSMVISKIKHKYHDCRIVLCIEEVDINSENYNERLKRRSFYEKNGFSYNGVKVCENKVNYELMVYGGNVSFEEFEQLMHNYLGEIYWLFCYNLRNL